MGGGVAASFRTGLPNSDFRADIANASAARRDRGVCGLSAGVCGDPAAAADAAAPGVAARGLRDLSRLIVTAATGVETTTPGEALVLLRAALLGVWAPWIGSGGGLFFHAASSISPFAQTLVSSWFREASCGISNKVATFRKASLPRSFTCCLHLRPLAFNHSTTS